MSIYKIKIWIKDLNRINKRWNHSQFGDPFAVFINVQAWDEQNAEKWGLDIGDLTINSIERALSTFNFQY